MSLTIIRLSNNHVITSHFGHIILFLFAQGIEITLYFTSNYNNYIVGHYIAKMRLMLILETI